jgi:hypothetical protein
VTLMAPTCLLVISKGVATNYFENNRKCSDLGRE